jgi:hypothetical protein
MTDDTKPSRREFMAGAAAGAGSLALAVAANAATPTDASKESALSTAPAFQTSDKLGGNGKPGASERQAIAQAFGSFDLWETEFRKIGAGLGGRLGLGHAGLQSAHPPV